MELGGIKFTLMKFIIIFGKNLNLSKAKLVIWGRFGVGDWNWRMRRDLGKE